MNSTDLKELLHKIRSTNKASRYLDAEIHAWKLNSKYDGFDKDKKMFRFKYDNYIDFIEPDEVPNYTYYPTGFSACLCLFLIKMPGFVWEKSKHGGLYIYRSRYVIFPVDMLEEYSKPLSDDCLKFLDAIVSTAYVLEREKEEASEVSINE